MTRILTRISLATSGAILGTIGFAMLTRTKTFLSMSGVEISADPSLLSELKAPSLLLVLAGAIMLYGSFRSRFADLGLAIGTIVYGSYGLARLAGILLDGLPSGSLLIAMVIELVCAALLLSLRITKRSDTPVQTLQLNAA